MANILKNVDKIITSGPNEKEIDLHNLQASGGNKIMTIGVSGTQANYYFGRDITFTVSTTTALSGVTIADMSYSIDGATPVSFASSGTGSFTFQENTLVTQESNPTYTEIKDVVITVTDSLGNTESKTMSLTMEHMVSFTADYLLAAGGGAGGSGHGAGAGGGAGGLIISNMDIGLGVDQYVEIGNGGTSLPNTGGNYSTQIYPGGNSTFGSIIAFGGGGGTYGMRVSMAADSAFNKGGSGGGGEGGWSDYGGYGYNTTNAAAWGNPSSMINQGNDGAAGSVLSGNYFGGGGGGAGSAGGDGSSTARTNTSAGSANGNGGAGLSSDITGTTAWYAGGGAGGRHHGGSGSGGSGVGGVAWQSGAANTGSGGGGSSGGGTTAAGHGGSGVLILLVPTTVELDTVDASLTINGSGGSTTPPSPQTGRDGKNLYIITAGSGNISFKSV